MRTQAEKAALFEELHRRPGAFIIPNPWDAGTARLLASLGFEALATTSLGLALTLGRGTVSRDEILANCRAIAEATSLPVNADLENCGADDPREAAETIRLACDAGMVGGSIEDFTGDPRDPVYDFTLAVERAHAAVEVARSLPIPFILTARAENMINGRPDLAHADPAITAAELSAIGVKRISVGGSISRYVLGAFLAAGREMKEHGAFTFIRDAIPSRILREGFAGGA